MKLPYERADGTVVLWPKFTEVLEHLAAHPEGTTTRQLVDALGLRTAQVTGRLRLLRELHVVATSLDVTGDEISGPCRWVATAKGHAALAAKADHDTREAGSHR